jgi:hypothetical protein
MNSSGPSKPKAAPAAAADMTKPRREILCIISLPDLLLRVKPVLLTR